MGFVGKEIDDDSTEKRSTNVVSTSYPDRRKNLAAKLYISKITGQFFSKGN